MLRLLLSKDWIAVRDEILSDIARDVAQEKGGRILMVPELISHDTERRLCETAGDTASRFAEVLSFPRLARRVLESTHNAPQECLDNGGRVVAMAAAARQLSSRLKAYASVETKPEFLTGLVDAVDEFKRCCISSKDLMAVSSQTQGSLAQKLEELSLLLEGYDSLCSQGKKDPRDQMTWLLTWLQDSDFAENHVFYIDGFPDYTRQHMAILEYLIRFSPQVTVGLNCDAVDSSALAFEKAGDTAAQILKCARSAGVPVEIQVIEGRNDELSRARQAMFQGKLTMVRNALSAWRCDSVLDEVQCAAEEIGELIRSGCRYRDIGIVCADMGAYRNALELTFHRFGIPMYLSGTEDILQKTVISTVLSAMDAALGGFEMRDVMRYLRSVLSGLDPDQCDRVENYAVLWGIRGNRWEQEWTNHPNGLSESWTEGAKNALDSLNRSREYALTPLFHLREGFRNATNLSQQVKALYAFLEEIHLAKRLSALADSMDAQGDNRSAQILNQLWEILVGALEQLYDMLGNTVWEPDAFTRLLTLLLRQYDVGTIPPVLDAVHIGPVSAMRCTQVKHLFVLGAAEGALPGYSGSAGILSDQERTQLRSCGLSLTGGALEGLQAEFAEIYGVFCGATDSITVSYGGGQPSYVWSRLATMAGGAQEKKTTLGAAMTDPREAGAWLAARKEAEAAGLLGVHEWYFDTINRAGYSLGQIDPENIRALYGDSLTLSASQVDRQAECRMSYFLKYGLRAKERKEATADPAEFGTYVHWVLENTAQKVMELGGFHEVSLEKTMEIAMDFSDEYAKDHFAQIDSKRISYLFSRNRRELEMVVEELWQELKTSKFIPQDFELGFGEGEEMAPIEVPSHSLPAVLGGFVDRVDIWKENGQNYFRVVDYKTGKKDFDYCDVFNGVGLQMLLYLFALEQEGEKVVGQNPVAAGVQYFPARVPLLSSDGALTEDQAQALRLKEWKRKGLLLADEQVLEAMDETMDRLCCTRKTDGSIAGDLADRSQLKLLRQYIFETLGNMVDDIASGNVQPNPYTRGTSHSACAFCPYGSICHETTVEGRRNYKAMTAQRFWEEIDKEVNRRG